jgi:predicted DNA binding CopG/RHH family protein
MTAKRKKLPRFRSEGEEADFWATNDSADYWEEFQDIEEPLELSPELTTAIDRRARRKQMISIRLETWQVRLAKAMAARRGVPYHAIIRGWVTEGIRSKRATS